MLFSVDCQWSDWSKTGSCSKSCGRGTQNFERTKLVESQNGGQLCTGSHTGSAHCNTHDCPSPGKLKISILIPCLTQSCNDQGCQGRLFIV